MKKKFKLKRDIGCLAIASLFGANVPSITAFAGVNKPWETDIWVAGIQVNSQNYEDVLGEDDEDAATVSYDRETNTLKLDGANIDWELRVSTNPNEKSLPAIYFEDWLTIETVSPSTINSSGIAAIECSWEGTEGTLIFKGEEKLGLGASDAPSIIKSKNIINQGNIDIKTKDVNFIIQTQYFENSGDCKISNNDSAKASEFAIYPMSDSTMFKQISGSFDISGYYEAAISASVYEQTGGSVSIDMSVDNKSSDACFAIGVSTDFQDESMSGFYYTGGEINITAKDENEENDRTISGIYCYLAPCYISGGKIDINCYSQACARGLYSILDNPDDNISVTGGDVTCVVESASNIKIPMGVEKQLGEEPVICAPTFTNVLVDVSEYAEGKDATPYNNEDLKNKYSYMHAYERPVKTVEAKKATCTKDGSKEYYMYDDALGKVYFLDKDATNVIEDIDKWLASDGLLKATGHSYKNGVCEYCNEKDPSVKPDPDKPDPEKPDPDKKAAKVGDKFKDKAKSTFVITNVKKKEVAFLKPVNTKIKSISVPATVKFNGVSYKVVKVADKAFASCKKLTKVTIGKNVIKIGANAFSGCKKLKTLTIKNTKLKAKNLNKKAFSGLTKKTTIKVAKAKVKSYKKMFKKKGLSNKVAVKAY